MTSPSPVCEATLLAPDFARLDDHRAPLCTPTLRALGGDHLAVGTHSLSSPHIASPALAGWTPRLTGKDEDAEEGGGGGPRLRSIERASLAAATAAPSLALPIEPVPLPPLLQSNFLSVSLPTNVSEFAGVADFNQTQAGSNSDAPVGVCGMPQLLVKAEPTTSAGSESAGTCQLPAAGMLNSSGGKHPTYATLTADGVAAALAMSSDIMQQRDQELEQQQQFGTHNCSSNGNGSRPGTASASAVAAAAADELSDNRLSLEFLEENGYFDMPIQQAAAELHVGVTTLKKVCRVNNIGRWPFRKRSSLNRLIEKTREYFAGDSQQCAEALAQLEAQRSVLQAQQGEDIPESVKRYRQSIFKLDYKVKCAKRSGRWRQAVEHGSGGTVELLSALGLPLQPPSLSPGHN